MTDKKYREKTNGFQTDPSVFAREPVLDLLEEEALAFPLDEILLYLFKEDQQPVTIKQVEQLKMSNAAFRERVKNIEREIFDNRILTKEEYKAHVQTEANAMAAIILAKLNKKNKKQNKEQSENTNAHEYIRARRNKIAIEGAIEPHSDYND